MKKSDLYQNPDFIEDWNEGDLSIVKMQVKYKTGYRGVTRAAERAGLISPMDRRGNITNATMPDDTDEFRELWASGINKSVLTEQFGVSYKTLNRAANKYGYGPHPRSAVRKRIVYEDELKARAHELRDAGGTIKAISLELGIQYSAAREILNEGGILQRIPAPKKKPEKIIAAGCFGEPQQAAVEFTADQDAEILKAGRLYEGLCDLANAWGRSRKAVCRRWAHLIGAQRLGHG